MSPKASLDLLAYLAVYSGQRLPFFNETFQEPGFARFAQPFWTAEAVVAERIDTASGSILPGALWGWAGDACRADDVLRPAGAFCQAVVLHNVLRTLGRYPTNVDSHGVDYSPSWFLAKRAHWVARAPAIQRMLMPLRAVAGGDEYGPWYHGMGVLVWGLNEFIRNGRAVGCFSTHIIASLNAVAAVLEGHPEDAEKRALDAGSASVACHLARAILRPDAEAVADIGRSCPPCTSREAYVQSAAM